MIRTMGWLMTAGLVLGLAAGSLFADPKPAADRSGKATGLRAAAAALDDAHTALKRADEDPRGRRNEAITLIEQAFTECEKGLEAAEGPGWKDTPIKGGDRRDRERKLKNYSQDNVGAWQETQDALNDALQIMVNESATVFKGHKQAAIKLTKEASDLVGAGLEAAQQADTHNRRTRQMRERSDRFYSRLPSAVKETALSLAPELLIQDMYTDDGDSDTGRLFHIKGISGHRNAELSIGENGLLWEARFTVHHRDDED